MKYDIIKITPEMASEMLKKNAGNRNVSQRRVSIYADDMKSGRWRTTPQGIIITETGQIIDGQHRLMAIVKSGTTVELVVSVADQSVSKYIDAGKPRSAANILTMASMPYATTMSSLARSIIRHTETGKMFAYGVGGNAASVNAGRGDEISRQAVVDFVLANSEMLEGVCKFAYHLYGMSAARIMQPAEIAFFYWFFGQSEDASQFLTKVYCGVGLMNETAELALRRLLEKRKAKQIAVTPSDMAEYFRVAFDKAKSGEKVQVLRLPKK